MSDKYRNNVVGPVAHILPVKLYWAIFFILVFLTLVTVLLNQVNFGSASILIAIFVAGVKSSLVFAFFMHLWFDSKFYTFIMISAFMILFLFIVVPILDLGSRDWLDEQRANFLPRNEKIESYKKEMPNSLALRPGLKVAKSNNLIFKY